MYFEIFEEMLIVQPLTRNSVSNNLQDVAGYH